MKQSIPMKLTLICIFLCFFSLLNGQYSEPKFGKIEVSDLAMTKYDKDTTAEALMLYNFGNTEFILNSDVEFQFVYSRHCQLKFFKKSALSIGEFSVRLYKNTSGREDLRNLKAVTYNLVDGKIVKTKLDDDNIYRAEGKNFTDVKFAFPELKEGSVIEFSYSITSDFFYNLRGWTFQYSYPALISQYSYSIPEYFEYRESTKGYLPFDVMKKAKGNANFTISNRRDATEMVNGHEPAQSTVIKAITNTGTLAVKNVPAFIVEPDIDCEDNYIQAIEFELSSIEFPGSMRKNFTQSWESVNQEMKDDEDFGVLLKNNGFIKDTVLAICSNQQPLEKAHSIYNYVQRRMKWNGENRIFASDGLKKPFTDGVGSSSEINLLLTLMLRTAGLDANPVMFSTRDNGIAVTYYPTISKFNSVLSSVAVGGKTYLLDARSKYCPFGVLPANDINGKGRVVNNLSGDWVNLDASAKFVENKNYSLTLNPEGILTGSITGSYDGYAGIYYRNQIASEKTEEDYFRKLQENMKGLTVNKYSVSERNNNMKPLADTLNVEVSDHMEVIGDKLLFYPLLFEKIEKSRYTLEERKYPIDYNYPIAEVYKFAYTIPEGYVVESLPESATFKLPDNSISISYSIKSVDNVIHIEYKRDVNKILFLPVNYADLKNLYNQLVKKHEEQVILKKAV